MEDHTGSVDVIQWMEEGSNEPELPTGSYIKVLGSMRTQVHFVHSVIVCGQIGTVLRISNFFVLMIFNVHLIGTRLLDHDFDNTL